jgi:hypothetical protein
MPQTLYELTSGKINRKNSLGQMELHAAPFQFVPTASELQSNAGRLKLIGTIPDTAEASKAAVINETQVAVVPDVVPAIITSQDLRQVKDIQTAILIVSAAQNEDILDAFLFQESEYRPRARKSVLSAIETRRAQLTVDKSISISEGAGTTAE